jgi:hypothetical protein
MVSDKTFVALFVEKLLKSPGDANRRAISQEAAAA